MHIAVCADRSVQTLLVPAVGLGESQRCSIQQVLPTAYLQILTSAWKPDWTLPCEIGKEPCTRLLLTLKTELDSCKGTRTTQNTVSTLLLNRFITARSCFCDRAEYGQDTRRQVPQREAVGGEGMGRTVRSESTLVEKGRQQEGEVGEWEHLVCS